MTDLHNDLPNTADAETPAVLLPYQLRWIADDSQLKVAEKGRRTGITWAEASDNVLIAASDKTAGGQNVFYIGYNQDMGLEYIEACAMWAKAFNYAASEIEEGLWEEDQDDKHIKTFTIRFPESGHRIVALSSRPANLRGKQGVVVIDEAAFHDKLDELLKAAIALMIWGGKVRVISTHNGEDSPFNELITEIRTKKRAGSVQCYTFKDAVAEGLYRRVCLRLGHEWSADGEQAWIKKVYNFYGEDASEELDAIPKGGSGVYLSNVMIEKCMEKAPVFRLAYDAEFSLKPVEERRSITEAWLQDNLGPVLDGLNPVLQHCYGQDFGRSGDLSIFVPLTIMPDLARRAPFVLEMRNVPFDQQQQVLDFIVPKLPRFMSAKHDARGNGQQLAEYAADKFGHTRIDQVMLTVGWYRDNMPPLKAAFEDGMIVLPRDSDIRMDLRAIKMVNGVARIPENYLGKGSDGKQRHADAAISVALGYSATMMDVAEIAWTPAPDKASRWDPTPDDDDDDRLELGGGGAW